jgi:hypothetical protein
MSLGGANISGSLNLSSTLGTVAFGQATVSGDLIAQTQGQQVDLGSANVSGNMSVQTHGGNIVQTATPNSALRVTGTSTLNAGSGNVSLPNLPNQFIGAVNLNANNVTLVGNSGITLGSSTVSGNLNVTSTTGNVTQSGLLRVNGTSTFNATQGDVVLELANTLTQAVVLNAVNANVHTASALTLGASTLSGQLVATNDAGDVTQSGPLNVAGTSAITATAGAIRLTDAANSFGGRVSAETPQALNLTAGGPLRMGVVKVGLTTDLQSHGVLDMGTLSEFNGKLKASSGGFDIIQSGPMKAAKDVDFDAGSAKIDLFNSKNSWFGALYFKGGVVMINHPQLLNAVSSGVLMVRAETTMVSTAVKAAAPVATGAAAATTTSTTSSATTTAPNATPAGASAAVSVAVDRAPSSSQTGLIQVNVSSEMAMPGKSFSFELDPHLVTGANVDTPVKISQMNGQPLPSWLRYDNSSKTFTANEVPAGAFPLQVKVTVGGADSVMVIQEKPQK